MVTHQLAITDTVIKRLFELADTPFRLADFRDRWAAFGWTYELGSGDEFGFRVAIPGGLSLSVDPLGDEVVGASLPFLYWEGYDPKAYSDSDDYEAARRAYDDAFDVAAHSARRVLASPAIEWRDSDEEAHRASVWEGRHGVLILQQACFDPQFGIELDFWLLGCSLKQFSPTSPLIDWLVSWSKAAHDARGFPPLAQ